MAVENFEAVIAANIRDFQRSMREVDRQIRDAAMGADAEIGADTAEFLSEMATVDAILVDLAREHNVDISANVAEAVAEITAVDAAIADLPNNTSVDINAAVAGAVAGVATVDAALASLPNNTVVDVHVNTTGANAEILSLRARLLRLTRERFVIPMRASWNNYQQTMGRIATYHRNFSEIVGISATGIKIFLSPAIVPILASVVGLLGQLGPMLGTIGGSTFALASAFGTAGMGAAAFGAVAITNLSDVFGASSRLNELQEKLDSATSLKERKKIMKQIAQVQKSMSKEQVAALASLDKLKDTWSGITEALETKTIEIFTKSMEMLSGVLTSLSPLFTNVMDSANNLADSLAKSFKSESMVAFFDYLNTSAAPMMETVFKSVGNFVKGLLSMFVAFGPLAEETANGFLKMSEGFAEWAAGLKESEKFKQFTDYVSENMPKIRKIFGDAISGIVNLFAGFGDSSADMMTSLQDMMGRFKEWSSTIAENQGFQNFLSYIKENGPKVVALIGNVVTFITNLGIALAPVGAFMLDMINRFLEWSNSMLEAHPWIGKIVAAAVLLVGGLMALGPVALLVNSLFSGVMLTMMQFVGRMIWTALTTSARWAWMAAQALFHAARFAAAFLIGMGPVGWVIATVIALAILIIANWDKISEWTAKMWDKVWTWIQETWEKAKTATAETVKAILVAVVTYFANVVSNVREKMDAAKRWVMSKWDEAKTATATKLATLVSSVLTFFRNVVTTVKEKMVEAVKTVGEKVGEMPGKVLEFAGDMLSAGKDLVRGLIDGIKNMGKKAVEAITGVVDGVVNKAKSLLGIASPSRVFIAIGKFLSMGAAIGIKDKAKDAIASVARMATGMTNAFTPELALADMRASAVLDMSMERADMKAMQHSFAAEVGSLEVEQPDITLVVDGHALGKVVSGPVREENKKYDQLIKTFRGKGGR